MTRINTNVASLLGRRIRKQNESQMTQSMQRLSTGLRINRASDKPADLIASQALRSEKASLTAAIGNNERADQMLNVAESSLLEISHMLVKLQGLVSAGANEAALSEEEKRANQLEVDSLLGSIDRIAANSTFEGMKLLNGNFEFRVDQQDPRIEDYQVHAARYPMGGRQAIDIVVSQSAQHAALFLSTGGGIDLTSRNDLFEFAVGSEAGSRVFSFASGTANGAIADAVNTFAAVTGVSASVQGTGIMFKAREFGSESFVKFELLARGGQAGAVHLVSAVDENVVSTIAGNITGLATMTSYVLDRGQDAVAHVNGIRATADGREINVRDDMLSLSLILTEAAAQQPAGFRAFDIVGGGARFALGPQVTLINRSGIGLSRIATHVLGNTIVGYLDDLGSGQAANVIDGDFRRGQKIVNAAIDRVSKLRGRMGAYQKNILGSTIRALGVALENTSSAESAVRDTDFAEETATFSRAEVLVNASTNVLAIANNQPNAALALLN